MAPLDVAGSGRHCGFLPAEEEPCAKTAAASRAHLVPLGLGVPLRGARVGPACEELAGDRGRVEVEDVPHAIWTALRDGFFPRV